MNIDLLTPRECFRCLYREDHPLGLIIDSQGVCSGCRVHEEKDQLDWTQRKMELQAIVNQYKLRQSNNYDCVVPVTGGQDSFFIVHTVIHKLGLNPLLVNFNRNFNSSVGIRNLAQLRTTFSADYRQFTINPQIARKVVRTTLANLGTVNWLSIAGQTSFPVRVASEMRIPLIIWGAHQGIEQVGMFSHLDEVEMTSRYRHEHDLMGIDEKEIFSFNPDFNEEDISSLNYPDDATLLKGGIRGIYLGNYLRWDPVAQHDAMIERYGYMGRKSARTYYKFDNPDCPVYNDFQDFLKQLAVGYGKVTDQLTREIRHNRITKSHALRMQKRFENRSPGGVQEFANWLGISVDSLDVLLLKHSESFSESILSQNWKGGVARLVNRNILTKARPKELLDFDFTNIGKGI
jgi:N-acetyl sugar amidotransferase